MSQQRTGKKSQVIDFTIVVDSQEKKPLEFADVEVEVAPLPVGDYSIKGYESNISIERKSREDFLRCVGTDRARFEVQLKALEGLERKFLLIESLYETLMLPAPFSRVHPNAVRGTLVAIQLRGIQVVLFRDRKQASEWVVHLFSAYMRRNHGRETD